MLLVWSSRFNSFSPLGLLCSHLGSQSMDVYLFEFALARVILEIGMGACLMA